MAYKDKGKKLENKRRFYRKQRELGRCLECANEVKEGCSRCADCLARLQVWRRQRRADAIAKGLCDECVALPALSNNRLCADCYFRKVSRHHFGTTKFWQELKERFEAQKSKCALSGYELTLGVDAELDHINPTAKGGVSDVANTQWVLKAVNRMKDNMLEGDFYDLVEALYKHMRKARR